MFDEGKVQTALLAIFGLVVIVVGIALAAGAKRAQYSETARVGFNTLVAIVIVAIGMGADRVCCVWQEHPGCARHRLIHAGVAY